ncbi:MAG: PorP/SprF family type IX secretion system membrane protein [Crocinitomix sp.]|nr:PorP/SprF family type IX secretion system membrane protein [Crocinitomix sp.]
MMSIPKVLTVIFALLSTSLFAQQDPIYISEGQRSFWFNPASIGTYNSYSINTVGQLRFVNYEGAPKGLQLNGALKCMKIGDSENPFSTGAVGINYRYDRYGMMEMHHVSVPINIQFKIKNTYLSVGVSPGLQSIGFDALWIPPTSVADPAILPVMDASQTKFDAGAGVQWYGRNFSLGFASTHLFEQRYDELGFEAARHIYLSGSYSYPFNDKFALKATGVGRSVNGFYSTQAMLSGIFGSKNELTFGIGWRDRNTLMGAITKRFNKFYLGYFLDYGSSQLTNGGWFSHEVRIAFELFDSNL